jgi:glycosyltransferase involved in cell wall biosynthesis
MLNYTLVIPILNKPEYLIQLIHSIPKEEIPERVLIINNGEEAIYDILKLQIADILTYWNDWKDVDVYYESFGYNLGVAKSWNVATDISKAPWLISNFDMVFSKGAIKKFIDALEENDIVTLDWGYCLFACKPSLFEKVGKFDENFWTSYWEDTDFDRRVSLCPDVKKLVLNAVELRVQHGGCKTAEGYENKPLGDFLHVCRAMNESYYVTKWGGTLNHETFKSPFNKEAPLSFWEIDKELMSKKFDLWNTVVPK